MSADRAQARPGTVTLVGAGPGDPELLTLKAIRALRRATVVLVDDLVDPRVLRFVRRSARIVPVGKRGGRISVPQALIHKRLIAEARHGETVVRLKGGDPFVFGRGGEEADALRAEGIAVEVIGGLTSGIAGPAAVGIPVTDRRHSPGVALVTGHAQDGGDGPDWAALARSGLTLVIYMGVAQAEAWAARLLAGGLAPGTPVAIVCAAHTARQRRIDTTLATVAAVVRDGGVEAPAVVVVGTVARLGREGMLEVDAAALAALAPAAGIGPAGGIAPVGGIASTGGLAPAGGISFASGTASTGGTAPAGGTARDARRRAEA